MMKNVLVNQMPRMCCPHSLAALSLSFLTLVGCHTAQAQASLSLTADTPAVSVGSVVTFTVKLTGGTNLAGYNINVLIDPTRLQFVNTGGAYYTSTHPSLVYIGSQVNTTTTASGVGPGGDLNFVGGDFSSLDNTGTTTLGTFQVKVLSTLPATGSSVSFGPLQAGVGFQGTNVIDPNKTNEATSATSVNLTNAVPISGTVSLQGVASGSLAQPLTFTLTPTGTNTGSATTQTLTPSAADGSFTLSGVPAGTYTLGIKGAKWLNRKVSVDTTAGASSVGTVSLLGGDMTGDNRVNLQDYAVLSAAYNTRAGDANWNALADLNCDGRVNLQDYAILSGNYNTRGDQ